MLFVLADGYGLTWKSRNPKQRCGCQVLHLLETVLSSVVALMAIEASRKDAMHNLTVARDEVMHRRAAAAVPAAVSAINLVQARSSSMTGTSTVAAFSCAISHARMLAHAPAAKKKTELVSVDALPA